MNNAVVDAWGYGSFVAVAAKENLGVVIVGGLMGGLLQPIVSKLNPRAENPPNSSFWQSPLLGLAAAGISVYVVAHTQTAQAVPLLFFALLCGLAFPAVLSQAVDTMSQRTTTVQRDLKKIADAAGSQAVGDTSRAAGELRTTLALNPLNSVKPESQDMIESTAQRAVTNIAQTPAPKAADQLQIVGELQDVGAVAKAAGWDQTAQTAVEELRKLSETVKDDTAKTAAGQAVYRLSDPATD